MAKAIEAGLPKRMIEEASAREQSLIDQGKRVIVGVNKYKLDHEDETDVLEIDNVMVRNEQIASLERIRATRDDAAVTAALNALTHAAQHNENLLAAAVNAARVRAHQHQGAIRMWLPDYFDAHSNAISREWKKRQT